MKRSYRLGLGSVAATALILLGAVSPASASGTQQIYDGGTLRGTAVFSTPNKTFTVTDNRSDGIGIEVEWSYKGEKGVYRCYNGSGSGTTVKCSVKSGKTLIWRMRMKDDGLYIGSPTTLYTDNS